MFENLGSDNLHGACDYGLLMDATELSEIDGVYKDISFGDIISVCLFSFIEWPSRSLDTYQLSAREHFHMFHTMFANTGFRGDAIEILADFLTPYHQK